MSLPREASSVTPANGAVRAADPIVRFGSCEFSPASGELWAEASRFPSSRSRPRSSPSWVETPPFEWVGSEPDSVAISGLFEDLVTELAALDPERLAVIGPESTRRARYSGRVWRRPSSRRGDLRSEFNGVALSLST